MDGNYTMSQVGMHEFAIHDKPGGALRATITQNADGTWSIRSHDEWASGAPAEFPDQPKPQAAFDAFVEWASSGDDRRPAVRPDG